MAFYLDTSALVKIIVVEAETRALTDWLFAIDDPLVCSDLGRAELVEPPAAGTRTGWFAPESFWTPWC